MMSFNFKYITLLFGFAYANGYDCDYSYDYSYECGYNLSHSLNYRNDFSVIICDFNINSLEPNSSLIIKNNYFVFDIMVVFFIVCFSLATSLVFVSHYVYSSMINQFVTNYNKNKDIYEYDLYLFEYLDEFNTLKSSVLSVDFLNSLKYKFVKHNTPKGEIIMCYNHAYSNFDYYCKKSNIIDFNYLDVVARIYVVKNNCKNIYTDKCENYDYSQDQDQDIADFVDVNTEEEKEEKEEKESCIFYNKLNKKNKSKEAIEYVSNKYKYNGSIEDFYSYCEANKYKIYYNEEDTNTCISFSIDKEEEIITTNTNNSVNTNSNIGFKEFKKFQKF